MEVLIVEYTQEKVHAGLIGEARNINPIWQNDHEEIVPRLVDELGQTLGPSNEDLLASLDENEFALNNVTPSESRYCSKSDNFSTALGLLAAHDDHVL